MTIKRVPSFSTRPDFPKGLQVGRQNGYQGGVQGHSNYPIPRASIRPLQVLVVDNDAHASKEIVSQLDTLGYIGAYSLVAASA